jgi:hypothetical protein
MDNSRRRNVMVNAWFREARFSLFSVAMTGKPSPNHFRHAPGPSHLTDTTAFPLASHSRTARGNVVGPSDRVEIAEGLARPIVDRVFVKTDAQFMGIRSAPPNRNDLG